MRAKSNKFGVSPKAERTCDNVTFASKKEMLRYKELKLLQEIRAIADLTLQPRFPLKVQGELICTYVADFIYLDEFAATIVEDCKGFKTPEYKLKAKLFKALYPWLVFIES